MEVLMHGYIEDEEIEIKCPNDECYNILRFRYSEAFNIGQINCYSCGAQVQLDYGIMGILRDAVNAMQRAGDEMERTEQNLKDVRNRLFEGAKMTKKL